MALNQNAQYAYRYLQDKYRLSPAQSAGVVGNLYGESSLNTGAINRGDGRDGSNSIGIAQWNGDRARNLRGFGGDNYNNLDTQLDFVMHELQGSGGNGGGSESAAWKRLQAAQDVPSATQAFIGYERPQGWSADNPTGGHNYSGRLGYAGQLFGMTPEQIAAAQPTSAPIAADAVTASTGAPSATASAPAATADASKGLLGIDIPGLTGNKGLPGLLQFSQMAMNQPQPQDDTPRGGLLQSQPVQLTQMTAPKQTYKPWEQYLSMFSGRSA
ncbi:phage tail tip lysozyme [Rhizobium sp. L43]|uniref:phage tail tip lysozyme n=1 Tax=Rhizobium sp. L43 TaxID=2035452 RepID=UPI000BEA5E3B|nr:phage tail tip lysozyme [Rhizobium sp. L43]PDS75432.1 hypothetical protein CO667_26480 [Rhizobium sp. L43]